MNGTSERVAQRRDVLEEDLLLQVLRAGGDQHALAAEDGGNEIGERLAGAGAGFGEEHAALLEDARDGGRHLDLAGARLEVRHAAGERAGRRKRFGDGLRKIGGRRRAVSRRGPFQGRRRSGLHFRVQRELPAQPFDFRPDHRRARRRRPES